LMCLIYFWNLTFVPGQIAPVIAGYAERSQFAHRPCAFPLHILGFKFFRLKAAIAWLVHTCQQAAFASCHVK
jgi:hypothetical protein